MVIHRVTDGGDQRQVNQRQHDHHRRHQQDPQAVRDRQPHTLERHTKRPHQFRVRQPPRHVRCLRAPALTRRFRQPTPAAGFAACVFFVPNFETAPAVCAATTNACPHLAHFAGRPIALSGTEYFAWQWLQAVSVGMTVFGKNFRIVKSGRMAMINNAI